MTDEKLRSPGVAWEAATKALSVKDFAEADRLREFMVKSDASLMRARIESADPNFYANKAKFP